MDLNITANAIPPNWIVLGPLFGSVIWDLRRVENNDVGLQCLERLHQPSVGVFPFQVGNLGRYQAHIVDNGSPRAEPDGSNMLHKDSAVFVAVGGDVFAERDKQIGLSSILPEIAKADAALQDQSC